MSVSDVTSRISQIQSQLALLGPASTSTSGTAFASALDGALKSSAVSATGTTTGTADSSITGRDKVVQEAVSYTHLTLPTILRV